MNALRAVLLAGAISITTCAFGDTTWASVPSSLEARSLGTLAISLPATEAVVSLIGSEPVQRSASLEARRVFSISIPNRDDGRAVGQRPPEMPASPVPQDARWPDSSGRIVVARETTGDPPRSDGVRNPWEVRIHAKPATAETVFTCRGVVAGGTGGPIAFLNDHLAKTGDVLGEFRVAAILSNIVLLGRHGLVFVVPVGRITTISTVTDG